MLRIAILSIMYIVKLGVIILSVIMLGAAMLSLPKFQFIYAECCYDVFVQKLS